MNYNTLCLIQDLLIYSEYGQFDVARLAIGPKLDSPGSFYIFLYVIGL